MPEVIPTSVWQGSFRLFGIDVKCHVLDDGRRIIEAESIGMLFAAMADQNATANYDEVEAFVRWQKEEVCPKK